MNSEYEINLLKEMILNLEARIRALESKSYTPTFYPGIYWPYIPSVTCSQGSRQQ